jgi:hypothetical protein
VADVCEKCTRRIDQCVCRYKPSFASARTVVPGQAVTYHNEPGKKLMQKPSKPPKNIPTVLQLPGGVTVKGFAFRITRLDPKGRAVEFELATGNEDSDCVLWASPQFLAQPLPANLLKRVRDRIEESIEGPKSYVEHGKEYDGTDYG